MYQRFSNVNHFTLPSDSKANFELVDNHSSFVVMGDYDQNYLLSSPLINVTTAT